MAEKLIHLSIKEARAAKWQRGRERYGPVFIGHPLEELDEELLDAMNYAEEATRRGFDIAGVPASFGGYANESGPSTAPRRVLLRMRHNLTGGCGTGREARNRHGQTTEQ